MAVVADDEDMHGLLLALILLAVFVGVGVLAVRYGADSRSSDPRDARTSWR
jgi:hypothetical protein